MSCHSQESALTLAPGPINPLSRRRVHGMRHAALEALMAQKLEELRVYLEAQAFWESVNALLERPGYRRDRKLWDQTSRANDSITANISEGFEQPTDAAFAKYLFHSKGSLGEVVSRLREARSKGYFTQPELMDRVSAGESLSRSLGAFIRYLDSCGWNDRGRFKSRQRRTDRAKNRDRGTVDQGTVDQGTVDQGTVDQGTVDQGTVDQGTVDQGTVDQGTVDQGTVDQGTVDQGTVDKGTVDQGTVDKGTVDQGTVDQGRGPRDP
jgi:four helix bundle protein